MKFLLSSVLLTIAAILPAAAQEWEGRVANVRDGDTIDIVGVEHGIRLYGIDSPEGGQTCDDANGARYLCGSMAGDALALMVGRNGHVRCEHIDWDHYGRSVAECHANGINLNAQMVLTGWALHYTRYSDGRYADQEADAKVNKRGVWAGQAVAPWDWRRGDRLESEKLAEGRPSDCDIKGNISANGQIYHMPGQQNYSRTKIDVASGERWFCSEEEAQAAGWVAARR